MNHAADIKHQELVKQKTFIGSSSSLSDSVSYLEQNVVLIKNEKKNQKLEQQGSRLNNYSNEMQKSALKVYNKPLSSCKQLCSFF